MASSAPTGVLPPSSGDGSSTFPGSSESSARKHKQPRIHETEEEFGEVKDAKIAIMDTEDSDEEIEYNENGAPSSGFGVLIRRLVRRRHLKQYMKDGVLYREGHTRTLAMDELFLDLIVVANVAAIGHELRASFGGWAEFEKFFLLFQAIWFTWRDLAFFWNLHTSVRDMLEKMAVLLMVFWLSGIGLGAHDAFDGATRWVGLSAFLAQFQVTWGAFIVGVKDPLYGGSYGWKDNNAVLMFLNALPPILPYVAVVIIGPGHSRTVKNLYWASLGLHFVSFAALGVVAKQVLSKIPGRVAPAVNIESMTEKHGLLTIIVLGESLLAILFEASESLQKADIGRLYASALFSINIAFALFTLYFDADQRIMDGGIHAIRYNSYLGILWTFLHLPFHASLIAGATGMGLVFDEASLREPTGSEARAGGGEAIPFGQSQRWLFCIGVAVSLAIMIVIATCHKRSQHAKSKNARMIMRSLVALTVLLLPLAEDRLGALPLLAIVSTLVGVECSIEFILVEVDHLHFHGWKAGVSDRARKRLNLDRKRDETSGAGQGGQSPRDGLRTSSQVGLAEP